MVLDQNCCFDIESNSKNSYHLFAMDVRALCRVCFETGHYSLQEHKAELDGRNISIEDMFQKFSNIELIEANTPEMICEACVVELIQSFTFLEKVQKADEKILTIYSTECRESEDITETELCNDFNETAKDVNDEQTYQEAEVDDINQDEHHPSPQQIKRRHNNHDDDEHPSSEVIEEISERRFLYRAKRREQNENIDSGSFVLTTFTPSYTSQIAKTPKNDETDEADEVAPSDVRVMNLETVEVKAGNIGVIADDYRSELPIDDTRIYLCQFCPKAFSSSAFLISHVRKSHGCKYCARMFKKSTDLYQHIREEHNTFKCVVCSRDFVSNSNLRSHMKNIHKLKIPANTALVSYKPNEGEDRNRNAPLYVHVND